MNRSLPGNSGEGRALQRREWLCRGHRALMLRDGQVLGQPYQGLSTAEVLSMQSVCFFHLPLSI